MANNDPEVGRPGSFTKNFSWGDPRQGLIELYKIIRLGFDDNAIDVPRSLFRMRVGGANRPDFIPLNFFLFNKRVNGVDHVVADELVFQAINSEHSSRFDKLALFAFNLSFAGRWSGSSPDQRRPALWANAYIVQRLAKDFRWDTAEVNANDIERSSPEIHVTKGKRLESSLRT